MRARLLPLAGLSPQDLARWDRLAAQAVEPNPYGERLVVQPAAELLPEGAGVRLLVVADQDRWELAVPVLARRGPAGVPLPGLHGWSHPYCFLGTPLARARTLRSAWAAVLQAGAAGELGASWLALDRCPPDGPVLQALEQALAARGLRSGLARAFARPMLHRRPEPDYLDGRLSARHRKSLRRQARRLAEGLGGSLELVDLAAGGAPALTRGIELLLAQERSGWKGRAGTAMACRTADAELFRRMCTGFAAAGRLELWSLQGPLGSAATQSNLRAGDTVFHHKIAYDERWASCSPGLQVEVGMVEAFHRDPRWARIDSGGEADIAVSAQLYADRVRLATVLVPLSGRGRVAVTAYRGGVGLRAAAGRARRRLARERGDRCTAR